jgi:RNA polymerase sigma factor, sigma-70 family
MKCRPAERNRDENDLFNEMLETHQFLMKKYCRSLTDTTWDSDDLFQVASLKFFQAWKKNPSRPITKAFLYRIISHAWIDGHRKQKLSEQITDSIETIDDRSRANVNEDRLWFGIRLLRSRLPARQQLIFLMRYGWGMSPAEIAVQTGLSEGNVRVLSHRAAEKLDGPLPVGSDGDPDMWTVRYTDAFRSGDPARLLRIYQLETSGSRSDLRPFGSSGSIRCAA